MSFKTFEDLEFKPHPTWGDPAKRALLDFPNGYAVSVIYGENSDPVPGMEGLDALFSFNSAWGDEEHPYEIGVMVDDGEGEFELTYNTPITDDVVGFLDEAGVNDIMKQVQELPSIYEEEAKAA